MVAKNNLGRKNVLVGFVWNCKEMKRWIVTLLLLGSFVFFTQLVPSNFSIINLNLCFSKWNSENSSFSNKEEEIIDGGIIKRSFKPYGSAAYIFIKMGAYRGGLNTFAVMGLASKPLHVYGKPKFDCEWIPANQNERSIKVVGNRTLPDWGYGRIYTVVVVNCTFPVNVGSDSSGGSLFLRASTGEDPLIENSVNLLALNEKPESLNPLIFSSQPVYDHFYCGSPLFGNLSPQRVREWLAYHVKLFGYKSHFVFHDAGGLHKDVMEVLKPWIEKGYVTVQDIRDQEKFDGYYHNQFLVVNDCLHRYKFLAKWMFFFDIDEYIYIPPKNTIESVLATLSDYTQFTIAQMPMSHKICHSNGTEKTFRKWGFEKLVYRDVKRGMRRDRKYAIQPRNVLDTGVHLSQNFVGKTTHKTDHKIMYFHYHGTISNRREPCQVLTNATEITADGTPFVLDTTLQEIAASIKKFEFKTIGSNLQHTLQ